MTEAKGKPWAEEQEVSKGVRGKRLISDYIIITVLVGFMAICLIPILNTVAISFSDRVSAQGGHVFLWPVNFTIAPYENLLQDMQFFRSFWISIQRVLYGGVINVILCILTAYPLSKTPRQFSARNKYVWYMIFLLLFSGGMIPLYVLVVQLGLINTIWALVLPGAVPIFSVIVLMNYYKTIPASLEEAAVIDGAGPWYILLRIFVPLAKPCIAVVALWSVVNHWNSFFDGLIYNTTVERYPLQTYIQSLTTAVDWQHIHEMRGEDIARMMEISNLTFDAAKVVVAMVPVLIVYPFLQRYFVTGIVMGAVKE